MKDNRFSAHHLFLEPFSIFMKIPKAKNQFSNMISQQLDQIDLHLHIPNKKPPIKSLKIVTH